MSIMQETPLKDQVTVLEVSVQKYLSMNTRLVLPAFSKKILMLVLVVVC